MADNYTTVGAEENPRTTTRPAPEDADRDTAVDADVVGGLPPGGSPDPRSVGDANAWAVSIAQGE